MQGTGEGHGRRGQGKEGNEGKVEKEEKQGEKKFEGKGGEKGEGKKRGVTLCVSPLKLWLRCCMPVMIMMIHFQCFVISL
jgi:hypothetical protein